jgi:hypothetical protein
VTSAEAGFQFPVLGFTSDLAIWGFKDLDRLTRCGPMTLKDGLQNGMELVDAELRRWRVLAVRRTGRAGSFLSLLLPFGPAQSRIDHELEPMNPMSIEEVRLRIRAGIAAHEENYHQGERDAEFQALLDAVMRAPSVRSLYETLQPDTFEPY